MTDCEATSTIQLDIMKNKIPLPDINMVDQEHNGIHTTPSNTLTDDL